jgi:hypothetical protein
VENPKTANDTLDKIAAFVAGCTNEVLPPAVREDALSVPTMTKNAIMLQTLQLSSRKLGMVGSTACAFGRAPGDEQALYVTTDGGFLIPHESGIQDAKLIRMEVGESCWPLLHGV